MQSTIYRLQGFFAPVFSTFNVLRGNQVSIQPPKQKGPSWVACRTFFAHLKLFIVIRV